MADSKAKLKNLIARKKREDPEGFTKAERNGDLLYFLGKDLRKEGIDPSVLSLYPGVPASKATTSGRASSSSRSGRNSRSNGDGGGGFSLNDIDEYVTTTSEVLDELIYDPLYQAVRSDEHTRLAESMAAVKHSTAIGKQLGRIKVVCGIAGLVLFSFGLSTVSRGGLGGIVRAALLLIGSADLFRVSYNCYTKNYCSIFLHTVGGDLSKLTKTVFQFAKTAVGLADPAEDPFIRLKHEIIWEILVHKSLLTQIWEKVRRSLK